MIKSFDHKGLEKFFYDGDRRGIQPTHGQKIADILDRLDASVAVKVSGNWRITFKFMEGNAYVVDYMDYH